MDTIGRFKIENKHVSCEFNIDWRLNPFMLDKSFEIEINVKN